MAFGFGFGMPRSFAVPPFSPASLFANGEQGWWYDPSNYGPNGTLFQDSAGTTPVTAVEQPVGLQLDLSKGLVLGPELVTNGDFSNGSTGWILGTGWSVSGGKAVFSGADFNSLYPLSNLSNYSGKFVKITFDLTISTGTFFFRPNIASTAGQQNYTTSGTKTFYVTPAASNFEMFTTGSATGVTIDNISVKELPGNHRFQTTSANRPVVSARVNLLTKTEDFSNAAWTTNTVVGVGSTVSKTPNFGLAPDGTTTACRVLATAPLPAGLAILRQSPSTPANVTFQTACYIKSNTGVNQVIWFGRGAGSINALTVTPEWQLYTPTPELDIQTSTFFDVGAANSIGATAVDVLIWHPDIRPANQGVGLPVYQRVNTSTDYDSTGFPIYIKPNGSNQFMQTNSINFTATDKMTVWQGVRKLSDAATTIVAELSTTTATNSGSFLVAAPIASQAGYRFENKGTISSFANAALASFAAPSTNVLTGLGDISGDLATLRVNGVQAAQSTTDQGSGNYGNYPTYFYMRAGTSLPFSGYDYGSIARGAASTAAQIAAGEEWINSKTKAY